MQSPIVVAAGRVAWAGSGQTQSGKEYGHYQIELAGRDVNGKTYRRRVAVKDFQRRDRFGVGDWVTAAGDGEAVIEDGRDGKKYAKIVIIGRISRMGVPTANQEETHDSASE